MIGALRSIWVLYRMSLEVDWKATIWWTFLAVVQPLGIFAFAIGLRELVNGAEFHDPSASMVGAWTLAVLAAAMVFHMVHWQADGVTLGDKHSMLMDRRVVELKSSIPDLQAHEDPVFQADLHALQEARFWMTWEVEATVGVALGFLQLVGIGILMFSVQPLVLLLPAFVAPSLWFSWQASHHDETARKATSEDTRLAREWVRLSTTVAAGKEIRLFGMTKDMLRRHAEASTRANLVRERAERRDAAFAALGWAIFAAAYAVAIVLVVQSAVGGASRPGDVLMIVVLGTQASTVAARGVFMIRTFARMLSGGNRFRALQARAVMARVDAAKPGPPSRLVNGLTLENLTFRYPGSEEFALRNVNLELPRGSVVALIGENGAGKTTLVKLISGLYRPTEGRVRLDSLDLAEVDPRAWRKVIGAGFQDFCRFEFVVREAVGVGHLSLIDDLERITQSLDVAGASLLATALPQGLETQLGSTWPNGTDLSGGQWQGVALARSVMRPEPLLMILDEPTAALDPHAEHELFERISAATRLDTGNGRITLLVSHRFSTARMADLIVVLDKGTVVELGSHTDLMRGGGLYSQLYEIQAKAYR